MLKQVQDKDLKLLRIFEAVAESGGFSAAQAQLNMSQSAISTYMSQLETRLGMRLCHRGNAGFSLTDEGRFILEEMRDLFGAIEKFQGRSVDCFSNIRGDVIVGMIDAIATHPNRVAIEILREFAEKNPAARIQLEILNAEELEAKTIRGEIDVSFGFFYHHVETLSYSDVFEESLLLYCGKRSEFFEIPEDELTPSSLEGAGYVSTGHYEDNAFLKHDLPVSIRSGSMHMEGVALLILTGKFIGFLPEHYARQWVDTAEMRPILRHQETRSAMLQMAIKSGTDRSRALSGFLSIAESRLGQK